MHVLEYVYFLLIYDVHDIQNNNKSCLCIIHLSFSLCTTIVESTKKSIMINLYGCEL